MDKQKMTIRKFLQDYIPNRDWADKSTDTAIDDGWYSWYDQFCKDSSLTNKTKALANKLKQIVDSPRIDPDNQYVFFKNNCPLDGSLYDDFRICDLETGDVIFTIVPRSGFGADEGKGNVWGSANNFVAPLFTGTWKEIKYWFNNVIIPG